MKYCPNCGAACQDDVMFCGECGTKFETMDLNSTAPAGAAMNYVPDQNQYQPNQYQPNQYQPNQYQPNQYQQGQYQPNQYQPNQYQPNQYQPNQYQQDSFQPNQYQPFSNDDFGAIPGGDYGSKPPKKNKTAVIILSSLIGVMLLLIVLAIFLILRQKNDNQGEKTNVSSSQVEQSSESIVEESSSVVVESSSVVVESSTELAASSEEEPEEPAPLLPTKMSLLAKQPSLNDYLAIPVIEAQATSTIVQQGTSNQAILMFDGDQTTNWEEGEEKPNEYGIGVSFVCSFPGSYKVKYLGFKLGNWKTEDYYVGNAKPKTLKMEMADFGDTVTFTGRHEIEWVELDNPAETDFIRFTIEDVYKGTKWTDTVITDIYIYGE